MKSLRDKNRRVTHPEAILWDDLHPALNMTQTEFALRLVVPRLSVSDLLRENRVITAEMAVRVGRLLNTTPDSWPWMQRAVDLWEVQQKPQKLARIKPLKAEFQPA